MSGPGYNSGYPPQPPGGYPPQSPQGYPPQGYPPAGYPAEGGYAQPFGMAQPGYYPQGGYTPPTMLPPDCYGGFWARFAAYLIDGVILFLPLQTLVIVMRLGMGMPIIADAGTRRGAVVDSRETMVSLISNLLFISAGWLYFAFMHHKKGATFGKMALGLRVVDEFGMYPSLGQATGRYFATILSGCVCYLDYILAAFDPQKRSWHDKLANTYVIAKEYVNPAQPPA